MGHAMDVVAKLDDIGKSAWIGLTVLAFILFWPAGLGLLIYLFWSGRMGCGKRGMHRARGRWYGPCGGMGWRRHESSGNTAFDEYKDETLRRLEEEQEEFLAFLNRLRQAKDKAEFDQFMDERRRRPQGPADAQPQA
jgi:hypothetical protein